MSVNSDAPTSAVHWQLGSQLEPLERPELTRVHIAKFAAAIGDFNPIHVDEEFARSCGFPSVIAHGPLTLSLIAQLMGRNFGPDNVRAVSAQFRAPAIPGDVLRVEGTVSAIDEEGGERRAVCTVQVTRANGEIIAAGSGKAVLDD